MNRSVDRPDSAPAPRPAEGSPRRVLLDDERVRRRQAWLGLGIGLVFPAIVGFVVATGGQPGKLVLWAVASLTVAALAAHALLRPKFLLVDDGGGAVRAHVLDTGSAASDVAETSIPRTELDPIELVWFPLEYPAKTLKEFHVRAAARPELVFLATSDPSEARKCLREVSRTLDVQTVDRSDAEPARDVPARYLTDDPEDGSPEQR